MIRDSVQQEAKKYPINEIFGPTIQGEGPLAGTKTWFIRFAGCDWDCSWALAGHTRVLTLDMRQVEIKDLLPGDEVVGYSRFEGVTSGPLHMQPTRVLSATQVPSKQTLVVTLDDGTELIAAGEHRFWEEKLRGGWVYKPRYKAGLEGNYTRADKLKVGQWLKGVGAKCLASVARTDDWFHGYLVGAMMGDGHVGSGWIGLGATERSFVDTIVSASEHIGVPLHYLSDTVTGYGTPLSKIRLGEAYRSRFEELYTWRPDLEFCRGYLAGIFDAEGTVPNGECYFTNKDPNVIDMIDKSLLACGFSGKTYEAQEMLRIGVEGGTDEQVRFASFVDFAHAKKRRRLATRGLVGCRVQIADIRQGPSDVGLYDIQTESHNFIAEGIVTHNCDSKYAVNPKYLGWEKHMLTTKEISQQLADLGIGSDDWVTLSGGNPALFVDLEFCNTLYPAKLAMETQGSVVLSPEVLGGILCLVVSPKPPSSGMASKVRIETIQELVNFRINTPDYTTALKYVIFDRKDLVWVKDLEIQLKIRGNVRRYLSVGTPLATGGDNTIETVREQVCYRMKLLFEMVLEDPKLGYFTILPQLHVLSWGQKRGV